MMQRLYRWLLPDSAFTGIRVGQAGTFTLTVGGRTTRPMLYNASQKDVDDEMDRMRR